MRHFLLGLVLLCLPLNGWASDPETTPIPPIEGGSVRVYGFAAAVSENSYRPVYQISPINTAAVSLICTNTGADTITYKVTAVWDDTFIGAPDVVAATDITAAGVTAITTWAPSAPKLLVYVKSKVNDTPGTLVCAAFAR